MHIDWSTLGLQTVNPLVPIWLLAHFLFQPVADAIAGRQKAPVQLVDDARAGEAADQNERDQAGSEEGAGQDGGGSRGPRGPSRRGLQGSGSRGGGGEIASSRQGPGRGG